MKKRIELITTKEKLEQIVNREDINILSIDVKPTEQSYAFQECFLATVFYEEQEKTKTTNEF